jgi:opacity protein-like surface antigen
MTLLALMLMVCIPVAMAQADDFGRSGIYAGAHLATGTATRLRKEVEQSTTLEDGRVDTVVGVGARAGFRISSRLAVEGQFEWLPGFDYTQNLTITPQGAQNKVSRDVNIIDSDLWLVTANVKYYLLDDGRFQPYALAGAGYARSRTDVYGGPQEQTSDEFAARVGLGLDAYMTSWILVAIDVQYVPMTGDLKKSDFMSVNAGLQFRF